MSILTDRIKKRKQAAFEEPNEAFFYERTILLEQAYSLYGHEPAGRRYALAFAYLLDHMKIVVHPDELLVGAEEQIIPDEKQEAEYQRIIAKPGNQCDMQGAFGFETLGLVESHEWVQRHAPEWFFSLGHQKYSIESVLRQGFSGIRDLIHRRLCESSLTGEQRAFYENGVIVCDAVERYAARTRGKLLELAGTEQREARRAELRVMADNFARVPMKPAGTFYEAIQTVWFLQNLNSNVCGARDYALGSLDQYLYPYYRADVDRGALTSAFALELIESLFVKMNEGIGYCVWFYHPKRCLANHSVQYLYVGGADEAGNDLVNELSFLILDADEELRLQQPNVQVHYHQNIDPNFLRRAVEVLKTGRCDPAFFNDPVVTQALVNCGVKREDARKFTHYGCNNVHLDSMEDEIREVWNIMPKLVELALNNGVDMLTGRLLTAPLSPVEELTDLDAVYEAVRRHLAYSLKNALQTVAKGDETYRRNKEFSFESLMIPYCLEHGVDMTRSTPYKHCNVHASGIATAGDSLYAIDRLVFREKRLTLVQLRDILKNNWAGSELLQAEVCNTFPKFGNDSDEADQYTVRLARLFVEEVQKQSPIAGEPEGYDRLLFPTFYSLVNAVDYGRVTAASANGRAAGDMISENQSPTYGAAVKGPTAFLNSVAKLPFDYTAGGGLNFSIQPQFVAGEKGTENLETLIRGYFGQGGLHMQVMIMDESQLEDAVEHPEQHRDLLVRVTGYSAYFVTLSPDEQQEIIRRTRTQPR